jgi:threonyl-tRNA synthetase
MIGFLLEHYAGNFPVWLSPDQVTVIPVSESHNDYAEKIARDLRALDVRAEADLSSDRMNAKIRAAQLLKIPYMPVVGDKEMSEGTVSLRKRDGSQVNSLPVAEFNAMVRERIATRAAEL